MRVLNRKLGRDVRENIGVLALVVLIISVGTGSFIGVGSAQRILEGSQSTYYREYRFADFWVDVKKAPLGAVEPIAELPGVSAIETRIVFDVILDLPYVAEPLTGRLISVPERGFDRRINGICLVRGSGFSEDRDEEVILGEAFAQAHGLEPGDRVELILNRKRASYVIVGTAISPEYTYMVRGEGDVVPDPRHFGILYVKEDYARDVLDFKGACNQIVGQLVPGADRDVELLLERIDRMLDPYGVLATTPRERQASHRFLSDEIRGLAISAVMMPAIFLLVAALVLNILMGRFAERQRSIVGTLKALGYSDRQVFTHFLTFGVVVGVAGGLAGIAVGLSVAIPLIRFYERFYQFPVFLFRNYPDLWVFGMLISVVFSVSGTARGVWSVLKLEPAEAMRTKPPERGGAVFLERFAWLWRRLGFRTHIALRSLARHRVRTLSGVISSALAMAIILSSLVTYDSIFFLLDYQFEHVLRSDLDIGLRDEKSTAALLEGRALPGVDYAEPVLGVICDLRKGRRARRLAVTGLAPGHRLTTPRQVDLSEIDIPSNGLVLGKKLADILQARPGDHLELTPVRGRRDTTFVPVASIVDDFFGLGCYADLRYLSSIVGESTAVNSVQLVVNPAMTDALYRTVKRMPNAQGFSSRAQSKHNIEETFMTAMAVSMGIMILFSGVIALGSMLNHSLVEIGDRMRDICTFRVLGYAPNQIAGIFLRQNLVISAVGLVLAFPLGYGLVVFIAEAYDTELFRMPVVFRAHTLLLSAALAVLFVLIAQWVVYRQIGRLNWREGVQVKE